MREIWLSIAIASTIVIASGSRATAQATPSATWQPTGAAPQYFTLNLPAGVSLISAPLNAGQPLARDAFLGLPPAWPLFFGWDSARQDWLAGDQASMSPAEGYWVYLPTPATLVVAGQPYDGFTSLKKHVKPGWHLFGVPFAEGINWKDFKLYASGNPISLDTAVEWGWIGPNVITTQGSQVHTIPLASRWSPGRHTGFRPRFRSTCGPTAGPGLPPRPGPIRCWGGSQWPAGTPIPRKRWAGSRR